jgi:hypothetical protein
MKPRKIEIGSATATAAAAKPKVVEAKVANDETEAA